MSFRVLDYVDAALVSQEGNEPKASRTPSVWPSEASATRIDKTEGNIVGACHRRAFGRMVGWPITNQIDAAAGWRFVTGRSIEDHLTKLSESAKPSIFVASGVRHYVKDIYLPFELDLVVKDPETKRGWIVECKTIYGYMAGKQILGEGKPKLENIMQIALYLLEIKNGKMLKEIIWQSYLDAQKGGLKNRIRIADPDFVNSVSNDMIGAKLVYIARDSCDRKEFDITIKEDFDGSTYPCVDGMMWKVFTVESIYERYKTLQNYWYVARSEAERRLASKGVSAPPTLRLVRETGDQPALDENLTEKQKADEKEYITRLENETAALGPEFWPPAEYSWAYTPAKIELLNQRGLIGRKRYEDWKKKKKGADRIGDWQCLAANTKIEMSSGLIKNISDVEVGDKTRLGKVEKVMSKPLDREMVSIKPFNLLPLELTADHLVKTSSGRFFEAGSLIPMSAKKIHSLHRFNEGDELVVPFDRQEFSTGLNEDELAGIGLWLAEGHLAHKSQDGHYFKVGFTIHPEEEEMAIAIKRFAYLFKQKYNKETITVTDRIKKDPRNDNHYRVLTINSVAAARFIQKWTCGGNSHNKALPISLRQATLSEQETLLYWMKEGDGCTSKMRGSEVHTYTSVSQQLAIDVQHLLWRQGKIAGITSQIMTNGFNPGGIAYHTRWFNTKSYSSRIDNGIFFTKIYSIDRNIPYEGLVYDLTIKGSHEIPTISGVVHNCLYCPFKKKCVPLQNPSWAYQIYDLDAMLPTEEI